MLESSLAQIHDKSLHIKLLNIYIRLKKLSEDLNALLNIMMHLRRIVDTVQRFQVIRQMNIRSKKLQVSRDS